MINNVSILTFLIYGAFFVSATSLVYLFIQQLHPKYIDSLHESNKL